MTIGVLKFGGSSIRNINRINHVANIVIEAPFEKKVVVLSAMGDTTDYLLRQAKRCSSLPDKRELDILLASGEQVSTSLLAIRLKELGVNARAFTGQQLGIYTDSDHTEAKIVDIDRKKLNGAINSCDVVIAAGFQGIDPNGEITTLGRGGSDTSAVAIAGAVGCTSCDIYTDVDGIFTSDPNLIPNSKFQAEVSYEEALELALNGAKVIHPRAVNLASEYGVELKIRNTFKPDFSGTIIRRENEMEKQARLLNITVNQNEACVCLLDIDNKKSVIDSICEIVESCNISIHSICESESKFNNKKCIDIYVGFEDVDRLNEAVKKLEALTEPKAVIINNDLSKLSIIGRAFSKETLSTFLNTLKEANILPKQIEFTSNRISCLIDKLHSTNAAMAVHESFNETRTLSASVA